MNKHSGVFSRVSLDFSFLFCALALCSCVFVCPPAGGHAQGPVIINHCQHQNDSLLMRIMTLAHSH